MQILFILLTVIVALYFLLKKRQIDLFTIAFFSALIYFTPGLLGFVKYPGGFKVPIDDKAILVFIFVLLGIWLSAFINDYNNKRKIVGKQNIVVEIEGMNYLSFSLMLVSLFLSVFIIITLNSQLLQPKSILLPQLGPEYIILHYSAGMALILSFLEGKRKILIVSLMILCFTFLIGSRSHLSLAVIGIIVLYFKRKGRTSLLVNNYGKITLIALFGYIVFMGKIIYGGVKQHGILTALSRLFDKNYIIHAFNKIEPFGVQSILNEVILNDFFIGIENLRNILYEVTVLPSLFGVEVKSFNDIFQPALFPNANYGMAYNIWAEAISTGGYLFLALIITLFLLGINFFNKLCNSNIPLVKAFGAYCGTYWSFYIHRSSIAVELTYIRNVSIVLLIGITLSIFFYIVLKERYYYHYSLKN